jgi:hypothetical protein
MKKMFPALFVFVIFFQVVEQSYIVDMRPCLDVWVLPSTGTFIDVACTIIQKSERVVSEWPAEDQAKAAISAYPKQDNRRFSIKPVDHKNEPKKEVKPK